MADIDLIVDPRQRAQASAALTQAGLRPLSSSAFEDTLLAWGDGSVGRVDGESAAHNGRVEIHPGWIEFLHGYTVSGCDLLSTPFDREAMVSHVIGHLASTVIRAEVRAVNVVDMWWCAQQTLDWERIEALLIRCDTRLSAPGLWITQQLLGDAIPEQMVTRQMNRLPRRGRGLLQHATPPDVLRDPTQRTSLRWRQSFASTGRERTSVLGQMIWPQGPHTFAAAVYRVRHR